MTTDTALGNVVSIVEARLKKNPVRYTVELTHDRTGFSFCVFDVADTQKDREAVAADLEAAAASLRKG